MNFEMLLKRHSTLGLISHTLLGRSGVCLCCRLGRQFRPCRIYLRLLPHPSPKCLLIFTVHWMLHDSGDRMWVLVDFRAADLIHLLPSLGRSRLKGNLDLAHQHVLHCVQHFLHVFAGPSSSVVCFPDKLCCLWEGALVCPVHVSCGPLVLAWLLCTAAFSSGSLHLSLPLWMWAAGTSAPTVAPRRSLVSNSWFIPIFP